MQVWVEALTEKLLLSNICDCCVRDTQSWCLLIFVRWRWFMFGTHVRDGCWVFVRWRCCCVRGIYSWWLLVFVRWRCCCVRGTYSWRLLVSVRWRSCCVRGTYSWWLLVFVRWRCCCVRDTCSWLLLMFMLLADTYFSQVFFCFCFFFKHLDLKMSRNITAWPRKNYVDVCT